MDPGLLAAVFGDGRAPGIFVPGGGGRIPFAVFPAGAEETRGADGPGPGEGLAARALGRALGPRRDVGVDSGERLPGDPKWGNQGVPQEGMGRDAPRIRGPGAGSADGLETAREALWRAPRRVPENAGEGGERRARGTAFRVGQRRRTSQTIGVSLSGNHRRTWGKEFLSALVKRCVRRTVSPTRRRRCATRCAKARLVGLCGRRGRAYRGV